MKAHEFIRKTFDLDNKTSISELPDLPISLIVEMLNNYKEGKVKKLLIPRVSGSLPTDLEIEVAFPVDNNWAIEDRTHAIGKRQGAKWMREKLVGNGC